MHVPGVSDYVMWTNVPSMFAMSVFTSLYSKAAIQCKSTTHRDITRVQGCSQLPCQVTYTVSHLVHHLLHELLLSACGCLMVVPVHAASRMQPQLTARV